ncbi:MAG TPA: ADOP family duplicated permease [Vicinamibacterales bacterium]|nr:ADOP family duplicated permease [Vicinamibacterales bacterium]
MVRQTVRRLRRSPALTLTALLTLAIGIGASAAMFSVINAVLLQPLPYPESDRLVALTHRMGASGRSSLPASTAIYFTYRDNNRAFESVALWTAGTASVTGSKRPEEVQVLRGTHEFLPTLRVVPALGRGFTAAEDQPQGPRAVLLSHGYWQRRFGGAGAVGESLVIDGQPHTVVGVLPESFRFARAADLVLPLQPMRAISFVGPFGENGLARLRDGVSLEAANADVNRMIPILIATFPPVPGMARDAFRNLRMSGDLQLLKTTVIGTLDDVLWVLMGTVALLFLVACVNVANLQLVRTDARQQEIAIAAALGASRLRVVGDLFFENLLLGLAGGGIGLALAAIGLPVLLDLAVNQLPLPAAVSIDPGVLAFTGAISLAGGLLFGAIPALRYLWHVPAAVSANSRTQSSGRTTRLIQNHLLAAQVALALVLLVAAGLMARTFQSLRGVDPGFSDPEHVQTITLTLPTALAPDFPAVRARLQGVQERLAAAPGVASVGFASRVPLGAPGPRTGFFVEGGPATNWRPTPQEFRFVGPGFFQTMGIPVVAGRPFDWADQDGARRVAMVSESMARAEWGNAQAAIGKRVRMSPAEPWADVVGVIGDVRHKSLIEPPEQTVYLTLGERLAVFLSRTVTFVVRSDRVSTPGFLESLQRAVWSLEPEVPLARVERMADIRDRAMERTELTLILIGITGTMAALLGLVGIYGVTSYVVSQRFREMGIRMALGARGGVLWRMLLGRVALLAAVGVAVGVVTALALSRQLTPLLFGVTAVDPATYSLMSAVLLATALMAGAVAARRVTGDAPLRSLRTDG